MKSKDIKDLQDMYKLKSIINDYLSHWEWKDEFEKSMIALDYVKQFNVRDMEAFIKFCKKHDMENKITPTIAHDLNGTYSDMFLPRTSGYHKRTKGE